KERGGEFLLCAERVSARAALCDVRVIDLEAGTHQALDIVDACAFQVPLAVAVNKNLDAVLLDDAVVLVGLFFKAHAVRQAGASAAGDVNPEKEASVTLLFHELGDLFCRLG